MEKPTVVLVPAQTGKAGRTKVRRVGCPVGAKEGWKVGVEVGIVEG